MRRLLLFSFLNLLISAAVAQHRFDVVVVGANPGGITSAIAAARMGKTVLI